MTPSNQNLSFLLLAALLITKKNYNITNKKRILNSEIKMVFLEVQDAIDWIQV